MAKSMCVSYTACLSMVYGDYIYNLRYLFNLGKVLVGVHL